MKTLIGWFDVVAVAMLVIGLFVGRRRGMSTELLGLMQWVAIVLLGGQFNRPLGQWATQMTHLDPVWMHLAAYVAIAIVVSLLVALVRRWLGDRLVSGDTFGGFEYYLGMLAGSARFLCICLFMMAILHAPKYTREQVARLEREQEKNLGSVFFPPFGRIQMTIFQDSISGQFVEKHLSFALIEVKAGGADGRGETIYRRREHEVNEVIGGSKR